MSKDTQPTTNYNTPRSLNSRDSDMDSCASMKSSYFAACGSSILTELPTLVKTNTTSNSAQTRLVRRCVQRSSLCLFPQEGDGELR